MGGIDASASQPVTVALLDLSGFRSTQQRRYRPIEKVPRCRPLQAAFPVRSDQRTQHRFRPRRVAMRPDSGALSCELGVQGDPEQVVDGSGNQEPRALAPSALVPELAAAGDGLDPPERLFGAGADPLLIPRSLPRRSGNIVRSRRLVRCRWTELEDLCGKRVLKACPTLAWTTLSVFRHG